jgi:hypothetical protein
VGGRQQLLGEEGVALRAAVDLLDELVVRSRPEDAGQQVGDLATVEAAQLQALGPAAAVQLGQERPQRVAAVQLVGPVGQHQEQAGLEVAVQEGEHVQGRAVGPVQVLHDQHGRGPVGETLQQGEQRLEQLGLPPGADGRAGRGRVLALPQLGQQPGQQRPAGADQLVQGLRLEPPTQAAERLGQGAYGSAVSPSSTQPPSSTCPPPSRTRPANRAIRRVLPTPAQLRCATDEPRARDGPGHGEKYALHLRGREPMGGHRGGERGDSRQTSWRRSSQADGCETMP